MIPDYDRFPTRVIGPDGNGLGTRLRTAIVKDKFYVWNDAGTLVAQADVTGRVMPTRAHRYVSVQTLGGEYRIMPEHGCGCGASVKKTPLESLIAAIAP